jgi:hypothetical protein
MIATVNSFTLSQHIPVGGGSMNWQSLLLFCCRLPLSRARLAKHLEVTYLTLIRRGWS